MSHVHPTDEECKQCSEAYTINRLNDEIKIKDEKIRVLEAENVKLKTEMAEMLDMQGLREEIFAMKMDIYLSNKTQTKMMKAQTEMMKAQTEMMKTLLEKVSSLQDAASSNDYDGASSKRPRSQPSDEEAQPAAARESE